GGFLVREWCDAHVVFVHARAPFLFVLHARYLVFFFFFSSRRRHTRSVSAFLLNRSSDLPLPTVNTTGYIDHAAFLGTINPDTNKIPKHLFQGYLNIYNNYFKAPWMPDRTEANPNELNQDDARYG